MREKKKHPIEVVLAIRALSQAISRIEGLVRGLPAIHEARSDEFVELVQDSAKTAVTVAQNVVETLENHGFYFPFSEEEQTLKAWDRAYERLAESSLNRGDVSGRQGREGKK